MKEILNTVMKSFFLLPASCFLLPRNLWAMASSPPGGEGSSPAGGIGFFVPMILVFLIFYMLLIRPQAKQQKRHRQLLTQLKRGDEVVTSSGIHGTITAVADSIVTLEVADNVRFKMEKKQIAEIKNQTTEAEEKKKK